MHVGFPVTHVREAHALARSNFSAFRGLEIESEQGANPMTRPDGRRVEDFLFDGVGSGPLTQTPSASPRGRRQPPLHGKGKPPAPHHKVCPTAHVGVPSSRCCYTEGPFCSSRGATPLQHAKCLQSGGQPNRDPFLSELETFGLGNQRPSCEWRQTRNWSDCSGGRIGVDCRLRAANP